MGHPDEYWSAVDLVTELVRLTPTGGVPTALVDKIVDVDADLLNRVVTNYVTDAYLLLCDEIGITDPVAGLLPVVRPTIETQVISTVETTNPEELLRQVYVELTGTGRGPNSIEPLPIHHVYSSYSASPTAVVVNTSVGALMTLTQKVAETIPFSPPGATTYSRPVDPSQEGSQYTEAIAKINARTRARVSR